MVEDIDRLVKKIINMEWGKSSDYSQNDQIRKFWAEEAVKYFPPPHKWYSLKSADTSEKELTSQKEDK